MFSRPIPSDSQPKKGRVNPLSRRSTVSANGKAASPSTRMSATPKSRAKLAKFDVTIRPPVDIIVIMTNISQKIGVFNIEAGAASLPCAAARGGGRRFAWPRLAQAERGENADAAKNDAEHDQRHRRAGGAQHRGDGKSRQHGAHSVAGGHDPDGEPAPVRKPPRHQADDADIDDAGPDAAEEPVGQEQHPDVVDVSREDPAEAGQRRADGDQRLRPEPVDEPALRGREQRLQDDQNRERDLHRRQPRARRGLERLDEERPDVLRTRDRHHDDEAEQKLNPSGGRGGGWRRHRGLRAKSKQRFSKPHARRQGGERAVALDERRTIWQSTVFKGRMAEWFKAAVLKTAVGASPP